MLLLLLKIGKKLKAALNLWNLLRIMWSWPAGAVLISSFIFLIWYSYFRLPDYYFLSRIQYPPGVFSFDFVPKSNLLAIGTMHGTVELYDVFSGKYIRKIFAPANWGLSISSDGRRLAGTDEHGVCRIWQIYTDDEPIYLEGPVQGYSVKPVFSRDDRYIFAGVKGGVFVWNADSMKLIGKLDLGGWDPAGLAHSWDCKLLAVKCNKGPIQIWGVGKWELRAVLSGISGKIFPGSFSPNGKNLLSIADDIYLWDIESCEVAKKLGRSASYGKYASFSHDGRYMLSISEKYVHVWWARTWRKSSIVVDPQALNCSLWRYDLALSNDRNMFACRNSDYDEGRWIYIWGIR